MKFNANTRVLPQIAEKARADIEAVNEYVDQLKGVLICVEHLLHHQRPYSDTTMRSRISCYQPNSYTTNAPNVRLISEEQARLLAKIFVSDFTDNPNPEWHQTRLTSIVPVADPAKIYHKEPELNGRRLSAAWEVTIVRPSTE